MLNLATGELGVLSRFLQVCLTSVGTGQFVFRVSSSGLFDVSGHRSVCLQDFFFRV